METNSATKQKHMKRKLIAFTFVGVGALLAVAAIAGPPVLPNLNPPPPDYYTCNATGSGAICRAKLAETFNQEPTGIICGTAQNPVELLLNLTAVARLTRYYDAAGNLTRRFISERDEGTIINPATNLAATLTESTTTIDTLAVPGNFDTLTTQVTGRLFKITLPGSGVLLLDSGRAVFDSEGNFIGRSGHLGIDDYFAGNHEAAAKLCAALGSPGTP